MELMQPEKIVVLSQWSDAVSKHFPNATNHEYAFAVIGGGLQRGWGDDAYAAWVDAARRLQENRLSLDSDDAGSAGTRPALCETLVASTERMTELELRVRQLEAALEWALPFAIAAQETLRQSRVRLGETDIGAGRGHELGLKDEEILERENAISLLSGCRRTEKL